MTRRNLPCPVCSSGETLVGVISSACLPLVVVVLNFILLLLTKFGGRGFLAFFNSLCLHPLCCGVVWRSLLFDTGFEVSLLRNDSTGLQIQIDGISTGPLTREFTVPLASDTCHPQSAPSAIPTLSFSLCPSILRNN